MLQLLATTVLRSEVGRRNLAVLLADRVGLAADIKVCRCCHPTHTIGLSVCLCVGGPPHCVLLADKVCLANDINVVVILFHKLVCPLVTDEDGIIYDCVHDKMQASYVHTSNNAHCVLYSHMTKLMLIGLDFRH